MSSWLDKIVPAGILTTLGNKDRRSNIPEGVWKKCPKCAAALYKPELEKNLEVCTKCEHPHACASARAFDHVFWMLIQQPKSQQK